MIIACECLNIVVRYLEGSGRDNIGTQHINMSGKDGHCCKDLYAVKLSSIDIKIRQLVRIRRCGSILVHHCLHCGHDVFASHDNASGEIIFDKQWMIKPDEFIAKKRSLKYSPFFNILIDHSELSSNFKADDDMEEKLSSDAKLWLEEQTSITEKKIMIYTNEQFTELEKLKNRTYKDHEIISKKLLSGLEESEFRGDNALISQNDPKEVPAIIQQTVVNEKSLDNPVYDSEEVFFVDDVDAKQATTGYYYVDVVSEESQVQNRIEESDYISNVSLLSRSLPLAVPQFVGDKNLINRTASPDVPVDIAASMKALAQSLHGDKIFGDLPPPRFSAL